MEQHHPHIGMVQHAGEYRHGRGIRDGMARFRVAQVAKADALDAGFGAHAILERAGGIERTGKDERTARARLPTAGGAGYTGQG